MSSPVDSAFRTSGSLAAARVASVHLPVQLTTFIGRETEIATVRQMLGTTRLLTLTGAGGSGKTRLAWEVAAQVAAEYPDGLAWIELASLSDPELLPQQIAAALGIREEGSRSPAGALLEVLWDRSTLLVLDNCEHLVDACAYLAETLLRGCPCLRILATSREALGLAGERAWLVPPLSLPPAQPASAEELEASEAVQLFRNRARDAVPAFEISDANARAVAEICLRLDGIPLAIELAAARVKVLSPQQIRDRLSDSFRLLTTGGRTAVSRHRTLREVIDWSYDLLDEQERLLFERLSVFSGGFTLEAAEAVCVDDAVATEEILDLLSALVDKSLVTARSGGGQIHYRLLETVRQYAAERLAAAGGEESLRRRHAEFFLTLAEEQEPVLAAGLGGSPAKLWLQRVEEEHDNLRAALRWSLDSGEVAIATRLAGALSLKWGVHGDLNEARHWLREVLAADGSCAPRTRARALFGAATLAKMQADWTAAEPLLEEALAIYRELGDRLWIARTVERLGLAAIARSDLARAEQLFAESETVARESGNQRWMATMLSRRGRIAEARGDDVRAVALYEESVAVARETGNTGAMAGLLGNLGRVAHRQGDYRRAAACFRDSLMRAQELGAPDTTANELAGLAVVASAEGRFERAARLFGAAEALFAALGTHVDAMDRPQYERSLDAARAQLDEVRWQQAWQDGWTMPLEQAVAYALAEEPENLIVSVPAIYPPAMQEVVVEPARLDPTPTPSPAAAVAALAPGMRVLALGPLEIYREGELLSPELWRYAKPKELLLYLLSHPEGRTREQIGLMFWPDSSPAQVKNSFHVTLHHLRKVLGRSEWIVVENECYRLIFELKVEFDATLFEQQISAALREVRAGAGLSDQLRAALTLYRGDFLQEETVGDWHLEIRDHLGRLYIEGLFALGDLLMQSEQYGEAAEAYQQIVRKEDLHEEAHRRLMLCLAHAGERGRALRHYERLVVLLREELDAEPEEETIEIYERLRQAEMV